MKLLQIVMGSLVFVALALGQGIDIAAPTPGEALRIGKPFTVEVDQPDTISPSRSVSVVISLQRCGASPCPSSDDVILGDILFTGDYSPQRHELFKPPFQNFTFTLAASEQPGDAVIHVSHFFLLGAGPTATLETKNVSVTLAGASRAKFRPLGL